MRGEINPNITASHLPEYIFKILAPGIRLAWVIAAPEAVSKLAQAKQGADLNTSAFNQFVAYEVGKDGFLVEQ